MDLTPYRYHIEKRYQNHFKAQRGLPSFFLDLELVLMVFYRLNPSVDAKEAWTLVTGYDVVGRRYTSPLHERMIQHLHLRYRDVFGSREKWYLLLDAYRNAPSSHRLFLLREDADGALFLRLQRPAHDLYSAHDGKRIKEAFADKETEHNHKRVNIPLTNPVRNPRLVVYYHLLKGIPKRNKKRRYTLSSSGKYHFKGNAYSSEKSFRVQHQQDEEVPTFQSVRRTRFFMRNEKCFDREKMAKKMGSKWQAQSTRSRLEKKRHQTGKMQYDGAFSLIAGGVGVGKNAFIEEELYRLYIEEKRDIQSVVVMRTNQSAIDLHETLSSFGINAAFVPGVYSKTKHESDYIERLLKRGKDFQHLLSQADTLDAVDADCLFQIYHDVKSEPGTFPCLPVNKFEDGDGHETVCPYYKECGVIRPFLSMMNAPVWITTPHALNKTSLPSFLDPEKRSLQQAVNDLADVVFLDEVDEIMSVYDQDAVEETKITGDIDGLNPLLQMGTRETLYRNNNLYTNPYISDWVHHLLQSESALSKLHQLMEHHRDAHHLFSNKVRNIHQLGAQWLDYFILEEDEKRRYRYEFFELFSQKDANRSTSVSSSPFIKELTDTMKELYEPIQRKEKRMVVKRLIDSLGFQLNRRKRGKGKDERDVHERAEILFEMIAYLFLFEQNFRQMVNLYPLVQHELKLTHASTGHMLGVRNKLFKLLAATPTGNRYGYRMYQQGTKQQMSLLRYNGQTRHLLTKWREMFSFFQLRRDEEGALVKIASPTLVGLSGTAYIPQSPHFHVPVDRVYKLTNRHKPSSLTCSATFLQTTNEKSDYLYVSGSQGDKRAQHLKDMTIQSLPKMEEELKEWRANGENRKILITPSSYDDAKTVANVLAAHPQWKNRFAFLSRKKEEGVLTPYAISPAEMEREVPSPDREIDVLVAPLLVVSRGYNILQPGTNKSYFGTMFLFVRPYYLVGDMVNHYKLLHKDVEKQVSSPLVDGLHYENYVSHIRKQAQIRLQSLLTRPYYTSSINEEEMEDLCLYALVLVQQAIGRMQRGDTDAHLVIVDSKMHYHSQTFKERMEKQGKETSMIHVWQSYLQTHSKNDVIRNCFGTLADALLALELYAEGEDDDDLY
ncbi:hypothetical protein [Alkalihalobacillus sp. R86527]|uniref:pPIWI_RE_Z domain-containing protein n=1 Tax=Alkalihalobacillus sp. R86527 TaxID=3093863 RepID=UPI0036721E58